MFQNDLLFLAHLADPNMVIFFGFGSVITLLFLLRKTPYIKALISVLGLLEAAFVWKVIIDLVAPSLHLVPERFEQLAVLFVWHRWLLIIPIPLLLAAAIIILAVYRDRINETHSIVYRRMTIFSVIAAGVLFLLSVFESAF
jgi:hypothetical protein